MASSLAHCCVPGVHSPASLPLLDPELPLPLEVEPLPPEPPLPELEPLPLLEPELELEPLPLLEPELELEPLPLLEPELPPLVELPPVPELPPLPELVLPLLELELPDEEVLPTPESTAPPLLAPELDVVPLLEPELPPEPEPPESEPELVRLASCPPSSDAAASRGPIDRPPQALSAKTAIGSPVRYFVLILDPKSG